MRKIFVFWIAFIIILAIGIGLTVYSKTVLKAEERKAGELREMAIPRPSRAPKTPPAGEPKKELPKVEVKPLPKAESEVTEDVAVPAMPGLPSVQDIPVQINTDSLEISVPSPSVEKLNPSQESEPAQ